jgi:respiratory burst oxidase
MAARERRREQAQLNRSRAGARRALKGLRFISRTTGSVEAAELWRRVEERFNNLAREGLLSRDDFGECIGTSCCRCCFLAAIHIVIRTCEKAAARS